MSGDTATTKRTPYPADRAATPIPDWMRWNDIASTPVRLRSSLDLSGRFVTQEIEESESAG
jgi:hypothetical protein